MNILIVGRRMREYPRNRTLLDALKKVHTAKECEVPAGNWAAVKLLWQERSSHDAVLLLQPTKELVLPLCLARPFLRAEVVGDVFTSLYDTFVVDRALVGKWSVKALYYFFIDWLFVCLCSVLLFDTEEHKEYFERVFGLGGRRSIIVPVAVDTDALRSVQPKKLPHAEEGQFQVLFCGYFIPLQGIEHIIRAAHILRDNGNIHFTLLGNGQTRREMELLAEELKLANLTFMGRVPYEEYLSYIKGADLSLGIFGGSDKAKRVIPNKVVESAALGVPLATGKSSPVARFFADGESIFFANMSDPGDLAKTIERAYHTKNLAEVGSRGQEVAAQYFSQKSLCDILKKL